MFRLNTPSDTSFGSTKRPSSSHQTAAGPANFFVAERRVTFRAAVPPSKHPTRQRERHHTAGRVPTTCEHAPHGWLQLPSPAAAAENPAKKSAHYLAPYLGTCGAHDAFHHTGCERVATAAAWTDRRREDLTEDSAISIGWGLGRSAGGWHRLRGDFLCCALLQFFVSRFTIDSLFVVTAQNR